MAELQIPDLLRTLESSREVSIHSSASSLSSEIWFRTPPLTRKDLSHLVALQLVTVACDQGWTTHGHQGSMSWFELGVFPGATSDDDAKKFENRRQWRRSHYNRIAYEHPAFIQGPVVALTQDGVPLLSAGDCIVVRACAKNQGWKNNATRGELRFWRWFEPVQDVVQSHLAND
jgi:hypothetical protein